MKKIIILLCVLFSSLSQAWDKGALCASSNPTLEILEEFNATFVLDGLSAM